MIEEGRRRSIRPSKTFIGRIAPEKNEGTIFGLNLMSFTDRNSDAAVFWGGRCPILAAWHVVKCQPDFVRATGARFATLKRGLQWIFGAPRAGYPS